MSQVTRTSQGKSANQTSKNNNQEPIQNYIIKVLKPIHVESVSSNNHLKDNTTADNPGTSQNLGKEQVTCQSRIKHECPRCHTQAQMSSALKKLESISQAQNGENSNIIQTNTLYCNHGNNESSKFEDEFHFFGLNIAAQMRSLPLDIALKMQTEIQNILCSARIKAQKGTTTTRDNTNPSSPQSIKGLNNKYVFQQQDDDKDPDEEFDLLGEDDHSPDRSQ